MTRIVTFAVALVVVAAPASGKPAGEFLKDAVQGDRSEMTLGNVLKERGASAQVRAYGATLASDHEDALREATSLAQRMHVQVSDTMTSEAQNELSKLKRLKGKAFDREARRYMVEDHRKDVAEFKHQADHGNRQTAALAKKTLPVLQKHLKMAEALPQ